MKNWKLYIVAASVLLAGCQQEELVKETMLQKVEFTATTENYSADTKTSLDANGNVLWTQSDQVSIFHASTINQQYQVTDASAGKTSASLTQITPDGFNAGTELTANVAYYPYASANEVAKSESGFVLTTTLPATQNYAEGSFGNGAFPMAAVTASTSDMNLKFKNVLGGLKLQLKGTASIASLSVSGNNGEILCGAVSVAVSNSTVPSISLTDVSATTVTLDCGTGVQLDADNAAAFVIALPPMTMAGGFTVTVTDTDGKQMEIKTTKSQTIARSSLLKMPAVVFEGTSQSATPSATDLSETETANCYIVSAAGDYKFKTVQGNSTTSVETVASAEVLWESFGTATAPSVGDLVSNVAYADNYISFTASSLEGNAVIAAKDATGNILWSWHIWMTDQPADHVYKHSAGTMMDRNLGATSAASGDVTALGLMYQWGRKDPFLRQTESTITWPGATASTESTGTIEYATANPTTFITGSSWDKDWYYSGSYSFDGGLWSDYSSSKGIYDPCPQGYKVPALDKGQTIWYKASTANNVTQYASDWDSVNKGMDFATTSWTVSDETSVWYPAAGYLNGTDGELTDSNNTGYYWSAGLNFNNSYALIFANNGVIQWNGSQLGGANGCSVRCLKE